MLRIRELISEDKICLSNGKILHSKNIDADSSEKFEKLANDIKTWNTETKYFPWEDVALSILKNPDGIKLHAGECELCNQPIISINFISPQWTWEKLCGGAGKLQICPNCKE